MSVYRCAGFKRGVCTYEAEDRWLGRCPQCGQYYNILKIGAERALSTADTLAELSKTVVKYYSTGVLEVDHVLGGGVVQGSTVLLAGERGAGKSSILLRACEGIAGQGKRVLYVSGEESAKDVGKIAGRLGVTSQLVKVIGNANDIDEVFDVVEEYKPFFLVVDSLQVMICDEVKGSEGSVAQGLAVGNIITGRCKNKGIACVVVNHMSRSGDLAGSMSVEHLVDTVAMLRFYRPYDEEKEEELCLDGFEQWISEENPLRILYIDEKNRNGSSSNRAFFCMTDKGLVAIPKRSKLDPTPPPLTKTRRGLMSLVPEQK